MKSIISFSVFFFFFLQFGSAQTDGKTKATSPNQTQQKGDIKQVSPASAPIPVNKANPNASEKPSQAKPAASPAPVNQTATPVKKDGTPDRRYKENKKLKKDGTPDMRYKENKEKPKQSSGK